MPNIPQAIIKFIKDNKNNSAVTELDLSNLGLNDNDISELHDLLQDNKYITSLNLYRNNITGTGCAFFNLIPGLTKVNLSNNNIGDQGIEHLVKTRIENLDVSYCGIKQSGAEILLKHINKYKNLVVMGNDDIDKKTLEQLRKPFVGNPNVPTSSKDQLTVASLSIK